MTQTVPDISPLMPMHQDPLLVNYIYANSDDLNMDTYHMNQWGKYRYLYRSPCRVKITLHQFTGRGFKCPRCNRLMSSMNLCMWDSVPYLPVVIGKSEIIATELIHLEDPSIFLPAKPHFEFDEEELGQLLAW